MNNTSIERDAIQAISQSLDTEAALDLNELQLAMVGGGIADVIAG